MSLSVNYKPTNQKNLFNQVCVNNIKKWLKNLSLGEHSRKILFIYGSEGCGKTATLDLLLKNYSIFHIDQDNVRVNDVIEDFINVLPEFKVNSVQSIQKSSLIGNIVLLDDNMKNYDKVINNIVENIYDYHKKNIPMIICCSDQSIRQKFKSSYETTFIDFDKVSDNELITLIKKIFKDKKKEITDENINNIIETSQYNLHQVYHIIEHVLTLGDTSKQLNLDNLKKDNDEDLSKRVKMLFDMNRPYDFSYLYELIDVDTYVVNANIFQNYLKLYDLYKCHGEDEDTDQNILDQLEHISMSCDSFTKNTYDHVFDTDTNYSVVQGIKPLYYIQEYKNKYFSNKKVDLQNSLEHFSGHTYNYIVNYNELDNFISESFNNLNTDNNKTFLLDKKTLWEYISIMNQNLKLIHKCLNIKKRNVKYEVYIDLLKENSLYDNYIFIINTIWNYALFETNPNILKFKYKKQDITINLRIFKRLINIFTLQNNNCVMKTYVENLIKEDLTLKIIELQNKNNLIVDNNINNMMYDLSDLWSCLKN